MEQPFHPAANCFPMLGEPELASMAESIQANGLLHDIVVTDGKILDGRNRYLACLRAGVEPRYVEWDQNGDPFTYVLAANKERRHLNTAELAFAVAEAHKGLLKWKKARKKKNLQNQNDEDAPVETATLEEMATAAGVSKSSVIRAGEVLKTGTPELIEAARNQEVGLGTAAAIASLPPEDQTATLEETTGKPQGRPRGRPPGKKNAEQPTDAKGKPLPPQAVEAFEQLRTFNSLCKEIDGIKQQVEILGEGPAGKYLHASEILRDLKNARSAIHDRRPSNVCPYCEGKERATPCKGCDGAGWVTVSIYKQAAKEKE